MRPEGGIVILIAAAVQHTVLHGNHVLGMTEQLEGIG